MKTSKFQKLWKLLFFEEMGYSTSLTLALIFIPILFYSPLLFVGKVSGSFRVGIFFALVVYLFSASKRFTKRDLVLFSLLIVLIVNFTITNFMGFSDITGIQTAGNVILTISFAWALHRFMEWSEHNRNLIIRTYVVFFNFTLTLSILSIFFLHAFGEYDPFDLYDSAYNYFVTPFGVLLTKDFRWFDVYRASSFFSEPIYLGMFCAANIFIIAPYFKVRSNFFLAINIIVGLLTYSFFFIILSVVLFLLKVPALSFKFGQRLFLLTAILVAVPTSEIFSTSSNVSRSARAESFFEVIKDSDFLHLAFGNGFAANTGYDEHFSAGILSGIYEVGIINVIIISIILVLLSKSRKDVFALYLLSMLVFEPIKLPIFWMLVVTASAILPHNRFPRG